MSGAGPLSDDQKAAVRDARERLAPVERAVTVAGFTSWSVGIFGVLTLLWGLLAGIGGVVLGLLLVAVAWNERRGRDLLRALDPEGARILGRNQILLGAILVLYCLQAIVVARVAPDPSLVEMQELAGLDGDLVADLTALVYGGVAVVVAVVQYGLARFHLRRRGMLQELRAETPDWVVDLLAEARG